MKVVNIHARIINQPKEEVSKLVQTLATPNDKIWPTKNWPAMWFKDGLVVGSNGGHGRIRYMIIELNKGSHYTFKFRKPDGFNGTHELSVTSISESVCEVKHCIKMQTSLKASFVWIIIIRWLHDALIEEAFDNIETHFSKKQHLVKYSLWVRLLRWYYKRRTVTNNKKVF